MIPSRKISETILEFGDPVLQELPESATKEDFEAVMLLVVSAWNAVVLDEWNKTRKFEKEFIKARIKPNGSLGKEEKSSIEEYEEALSKVKIPKKVFIKEPVFEDLKRIFGKDVEILVSF